MKYVSVIIVSYNTKELTRNCLRSLFEQTVGIDFEVIVSDNGSQDGSIDMIRTEFPQVIVIENGKNLGFGKANNCAASVATGKYLFFLNSDTVLLNNALKCFCDAAEQEDCVLGTYLCDYLGDSMHSYGNFTQPFLFMLKKNIYDFYPCVLKKRLAQIQKNLVQECLSERYVDFITGADLFISKKHFDAVHGFDERYFMYFEDDDLCRKCMKIGINRKLITSPKIMHLEGASSTVKLKKLLIQDDSFFVYIKNWERPLVRFLVVCVFWLLFPLRLCSKSLSVKEKVQMMRGNKKRFFTVNKYAYPVEDKK